MEVSVISSSEGGLAQRGIFCSDFEEDAFEEMTRNDRLHYDRIRFHW